MVGFVCCDVMARPHDAVAPLPHNHVRRVQASKLSNCQVVGLSRCTSGCIKAASHQGVGKQMQDAKMTLVTGWLSVAFTL